MHMHFSIDAMPFQKVAKRELTSRKCKNVLQGSTDLDSSDVGGGVDPKVWTGK